MPTFFCDFSTASIIIFHCSWETVINSYWLSENKEIQKVCQTNYIYVYRIHLTFCPYLLQVTVRFLGERRVIEALSDTQLPQPSTNTLQVLSVRTTFYILKTIRYMYILYYTLSQCFLECEEDVATVKGTLKLFRELTSSKENNSFILEHQVSRTTCTCILC